MENPGLSVMSKILKTLLKNIKSYNMFNHKPIPWEEVQAELRKHKAIHVTIVVYDGQEVDVMGTFKDDHLQNKYVPTVERPVEILTGGSIYKGSFFFDSGNRKQNYPYAFLPTILDEPRFTTAYRNNISKIIAEMDPLFLSKKHYKEMMYVPLYEKDYGKVWAVVEMP